MCPSYRVTLEEKHSTRGRARLLDEMMRGESIREGWKSEAVREALDLCVACKACKSECPESVDMAQYKAEFLAHHYEGQIRPLAAYGMGMIERWARLGSVAPWMANAMAQTPGFRDALKLLGGIAWQRRIPRLAPSTFRRWFASRPKATSARPAVILWADTFNNYFSPSVRRRNCRGSRRRGIPRARAEVPAVLRASADRVRHARRGPQASTGGARYAAASGS